MSAVVQAFDPNDGNYVVFEVKSGKELMRQPRPFQSKTTGVLMDEVEPLELIRTESKGASDPLEAYR